MLVSLLVAVIVFGLVFWLFRQLPIPEPFGTIAIVILILFALVYFIRFLPAV